MKVTFPHMGNAYISIKAVLEDLGVEVLVPPPCTKRTLELGTKYAPELACLPLKVNIGNYIESIEKGAQTIVMAGGCGPCRFGYYAEVQKEILTDLGYDFEMIVLERPQGNIKDFIDNLRILTGGKSIIQVLKAIKKATEVAVMADDFEKVSWKIRPREKEKGTVDNLVKQFHNDIMDARGSGELKTIIAEYTERLKKIEIDTDKELLKVGIVGEIYTIIEPFVNIRIAQKLGNMGVEVDKSISISHWIIFNMFKEALHLYNKKEIKQASLPYLKNFVGGHGQESIAHTVMYKKEGYDGVIHLLPFTCMPEIVAQSLLPTVSHDYDIPVMTLVLDEMTGEAGYLTRLEAFVDLINRRKEIEDEKVLSWN